MRYGISLPRAGAVLDGRDVGTVVCPAATAKLFVTASVEVRAQRRLLELQEKAAAAGGAAPTLDSVLAAMKDRDARDESRATAPLVPADDALVLDTTTLSIEAALAAALAHVRAKAGGLLDGE
jgi:cytidylate kinase